MSSQDIYKTYDWLRQHIIMYLCAAGLLSLILVGGTVYYVYRSVVNEKAMERLWAIVHTHKASIDGFLAEISTTMRTVTLLESLEELQDQQALARLFQTLKVNNDYLFEALGVINVQGGHLSSIGHRDLTLALTENYKDAAWFQNVMRKGSYISDNFIDVRQLPYFIVAIRQDKGEEAWVLWATVQASRLGELVEDVRFGETGHAYLVNSDGYFQTRPRGEQRILERVEDGRLDFARFDGVRYSLLTEPDGRKVFRAMTWLQENEWLLVVEQEREDVSGEFYAERNRALMFFLWGAVCIALLTSVTIQTLNRRVSEVNAERHIVDEQLLQTQKMASIGQFSSGIAHEINNPLAVIGEEAGWMQDILKRDHFNALKEIDGFRDSLGEIIQQVSRCREITHKILGFVRKSDAVINDVQINNLVDEVLKMREHQAILAGIQFIRQLDRNVPVVHSDPFQLRQVLLNLVNNAMDAVAVKKSGASAKITIATGKWGNRGVWVRVTDTGVGIPKENLSKIFDYFFTTKPPGKGTGLGLSICHGILDKLGAKISVTSQVGQGTTFIIKIPLEPPKQLQEGI